MCTRFVYRGDNIITGFNFDIDIVEWNHKVINTKDEKASKMLNIYGNHFTVNNAFSILQAVCQEGIWATRVSFVYSAEENAVYYVQNNNFSQIGKYEF